MENYRPRDRELVIMGRLYEDYWRDHRVASDLIAARAEHRERFGLLFRSATGRMDLTDHQITKALVDMRKQGHLPTVAGRRGPGKRHPYANDPTVNEVIQEMLARDAKGFVKYGVTTADNPLTLRQWLQHALEETLDKAVYLRRAIRELDTLEEQCGTSPTCESATGTKSAATGSTASETPSSGGPGPATMK